MQEVARRQFALGVIPALVGIPLGTLGALAYVNGAYDPHELEWHEARVVEKLRSGRGSNKAHELRVEDWRSERAALVEVHVPEPLWYQVDKGQTVVVRTGPGRLGWTWIDGVSRR